VLLSHPSQTDRFSVGNSGQPYWDSDSYLDTDVSRAYTSFWDGPGGSRVGPLDPQRPPPPTHLSDCSVRHCLRRATVGLVPILLHSPSLLSVGMAILDLFDPPPHLKLPSPTPCAARCGIHICPARCQGVAIPLRGGWRGPNCLRRRPALFSCPPPGIRPRPRPFVRNLLGASPGRTAL